MRKTHSAEGIASFAIALALPVVVSLLVFLLAFYAQPLVANKSDAQDSDAFMAIFGLTVILLAQCGVTGIVGLGLAVYALLQKEYSRVFPVVAILLYLSMLILNYINHWMGDGWLKGL